MRERIEDGLVTVGGEAASDEENQPVSLNWRPNDHSSVAKSVEWHRLAQHSKHIQRLHLRALLADPERCGEMIVEVSGCREATVHRTSPSASERPPTASKPLPADSSRRLPTYLTGYQDARL